MVKAIVLYRGEPDQEWYEGHHAELARRVPGATFRAGKVFGSPGGEPSYKQYAEFEFPDRETFKAGVNSAEMQAAVADAQTSGIPFEVYFVDVG